MVLSQLKTIEPLAVSPHMDYSNELKHQKTLFLPDTIDEEENH
jgi:hypothetical protein